MRLLARTVRHSGPRPCLPRLWSPIVGLWLVSSAPTAEAQTGQIRCIVTTNGSPASGTMSLEREGTKTGGSCGPPISVKAGRWQATVRLAGALDHPSKRLEVNVVAGRTSPVRVDFPTGVLRVRIEAKGRSGTGVVTVRRGSRRIGTLGAGVAASLSAGTYDVVVRYAGKEKRYRVELRPGQSRLVRARF